LSGDYQDQVAELLRVQRRASLLMVVGGVVLVLISIVAVESVHLAGRAEAVLWAPLFAGPILLLVGLLSLPDYLKYRSLGSGDGESVRVSTSLLPKVSKNVQPRGFSVEWRDGQRCSGLFRWGAVSRPRDLAVENEPGLLFGSIDKGSYCVVACAHGAFCGKISRSDRTAPTPSPR